MKEISNHLPHLIIPVNEQLRQYDEPWRKYSYPVVYLFLVMVLGWSAMEVHFTVTDLGWIGLFFIPIACMGVAFSGKLMAQCLYSYSNERQGSLDSIVQVSFGKFGKYSLHPLNVAVFLGGAYYCMVNSAFRFVQFVHMVGGSIRWRCGVMTIAALTVLLTVACKRVEKMWTIIPIFGALCLITLSGIVIGGISNIDSVEGIAPTSFVSNVHELPMSLMMIVSCLDGAVLFPKIESVMTNPRQWDSVLNLACATVAALYLAICIPAYLFVGDEYSYSLVEVLPRNLFYPSVVFSLFVNMIVGPIYLISRCSDWEEMSGLENIENSKLRLLTRSLLRTSVVLIVSCGVYYFNNIGTYVSIIRALSACFMILVIPILCHYKLFGKQNRTIIGMTKVVLFPILGVLTPIMALLAYYL